MGEKFRLDKLRISPSEKDEISKAQSQTRPKNRKVPKLFLKGPIPWPWLCQVALLPGKTLHVGMAIWFLRGLRRSNKVKLSSILLMSLGVDRNAKRRAIAVMEKAGLIVVDRTVGKNPLITIILVAANNKELEFGGMDAD